MNIVELTNKNFDQVIAENKLLFIDFWAEWCAPCKAFAKIIKKVAKDYPDITFGSINIDEQKELTEEFQIMSVPSVMILRDRVIVFAQTGTITDKVVRDLLEQAKNINS